MPTRGAQDVDSRDGGNVIRLLPPLAMPDHLLREGLDVLEEAFAAV